MLACVGFEQMHDDVAGIDQYPFGGFHAFGGNIFVAAFFERGDEVVGKCGNVTGGGAAGNHHGIRKIRFSFEIDGFDVFGFVIRKNTAYQVE